MKKTISIQGAPKPIAPYSQAIKAVNHIYVSGQIPVDPFTQELNMNNIRVATKQVMDNIGAILKEAGANYTHIVKCDIFIKDLGEYADMNEVYGSYFDENPPARVCVQVAKLPKDVNVEISCIAVID